MSTISSVHPPLVPFVHRLHGFKPDAAVPCQDNRVRSQLIAFSNSLDSSDSWTGFSQMPESKHVEVVARHKAIELGVSLFLEHYILHIAINMQFGSVERHQAHTHTNHMPATTRCACPSFLTASSHICFKVKTMTTTILSPS